MITHNTYSTQLFQLRFKVLLKLSGKVENERERLNTVLKCGRPYPTLPYPTLPYPTLPYPTLPYPTLPYPTSKVIFSTLQLILREDCQPPVGPYARIKLRFKTFKIKYFWAQNTIKMKREVRRIHWIGPKKRKPIIPKLSRIKRTAFFIISLIIQSDLSTTQFRLIFKDKANKSLEYCCLVIHLTSVISTISNAESNGDIFILIAPLAITKHYETYCK